MSTLTRLHPNSLRAILVCAWVCTTPAFAHDFKITRVVALHKSDGGFVIDMRVDVDALALGVSSVVPSAEIVTAMNALTVEQFNSAVERARQTILRRVRVRFDKKKIIPVVSFPEHGNPGPGASIEPTILGTTARLSGHCPEGAELFTFGASRSFNVVHLTIMDESSAGGVKHILGAGAKSPPYRLGENAQGQTGFAFGRYLVLGFEHILPKGLDHILFVLGLYLLSIRLRPLLLQVTAFTVAHSVTLALAITGVATLSPSIVEPLIALSIVYVAVENICVREMKPWRLAVVFVFGLLHGMGFAGVLSELGMPKGQFVSALVGFNIGVELGQLAVVGLAFLLLGWFRHRTWYRKGIIFPLSLAIALIGTFWVIERTPWFH